MSVQKQVVKVKCPHCGFIHKLYIDAEVGKADALASADTLAVQMNESFQKIAERIKDLLSDKELMEANSWIGMPPCSHCEQSYELNIHTHKTRQ